ncbi:MAG TPA: bifunctional (p)ppGpp synthetase/guanosine-3',5'-bis(diphosphate) 3'-pyrophosphohydrolase [Desulfobulbaceae bacterium]|nr:bifunctional (p)ppGpp synthetase/guanosine-3',5'-bis(diphosphate) 3'-pyrophosphohydrolase [Desulfobulbaceae bacterium]
MQKKQIPFDTAAYREQMAPILAGHAKTEIFWDALEFAERAHHGQWRKAGDAYILHPCSVARILAEEMGIVNPEIMAAGLLHDTIEDVPGVTREVIERRFGAYTRQIVEGCTKVTQDSADRHQSAHLNHLRLFSGAALHPEVMLVKLADRLHNMRTLNALPKKKRQRVADETLNIYAPLSSLFGFFVIKREMYNLAISFRYKKRSDQINAHIKELRNNPIANTLVETLRQKMRVARLDCEVNLRVKELSAYYDSRNHILRDRIEFPIEIHLVINGADTDGCYRALGILHATCQPLPRTIRDFIANPKNLTGYRSLHSRAVVGGLQLLFKIRTKEMIHFAQRGNWQNWISKDGSLKLEFMKEFQEFFNALSATDAPGIQNVIAASESKEIYTYTPRGDVIRLPSNATVLDFAFQVHSQLGRACQNGLIRNKIYPIDHVLHDGDIVKIIRADQPVQFPQETLGWLRTARARAELAEDFRIRRRKVTKEIGYTMLRQELRRYGFSPDVLEGDSREALLRAFDLPDFDEMCGRIGEGRMRLITIMERIKNDFYGGVAPLVPPVGIFNTVKLSTLDPVCVKLSACCKPDPTSHNNFALLTERGISVHHKQCQQLQKIAFHRDDAVDISWKLKETQVEKMQELRFHGLTRLEILALVTHAPEQLRLYALEAANGEEDTRKWRLLFKASDLLALQRVLRYFRRSVDSFDFFIKC